MAPYQTEVLHVLPLRSGVAGLPKLCPQAAVLSGKSEASPFGGSRRRERGGAGLSPEDGQRRSTSAVPPPWKSRGILPRVDQKQVGPAAVSRARVGEGANGDAVGLPHLQLAALDPLEKPIQRRGKLEQKLKRQNLSDQPEHSKKHALTPSKENAAGFFTASNRGRGTRAEKCSEMGTNGVDQSGRENQKPQVLNRHLGHPADKSG